MPGAKRIHSLDRLSSSQQVPKIKDKKPRGDPKPAADPSCIVCANKTSTASGLQCSICQEYYHAACCGFGDITNATVNQLNSVG